MTMYVAAAFAWLCSQFADMLSCALSSLRRATTLSSSRPSSPECNRTASGHRLRRSDARGRRHAPQLAFERFVLCCEVSHRNFLFWLFVLDVLQALMSWNMAHVDLPTMQMSRPNEWSADLGERYSEFRFDM